MSKTNQLDTTLAGVSKIATKLPDGGPVTLGLPILVLLVTAVDPVAAQSTGQAFCETKLATTVKNIFDLIQFGGPLLGGVLALGTTVLRPTIRKTDLKREMSEIRNQGVIWGIIVAPLGTSIVQFLLNAVVAGGASCSF